MKILLVNPTFYSAYELGLSYGEPLGLAYIAASIRKYSDHDVEIIDSVGSAESFPKINGYYRIGLPEEEILDKIGKSNAGIVGVSLIGTMFAQEILDFISLLKKNFPEKIVVVGGAHATLEWEECLDNAPIDYIVMGEGEGTIVELIDCIENSGDDNIVKGIAFKNKKLGINIKTEKREPLNIDEIPWPARDLLPMQNYFKNKPKYFYKRHPAASLITSRACLFNCVFCSTTKFWERKYRARNPKDVVDEIAYLNREYGVKEILINDDCFLGNKKRVKEICDSIIFNKINISYQIPPGVNFHLLDEELLLKLYKSGLYAIKPQMESGNLNTLKYIKKSIPVKNAVSLIKYANKLGMWTQTNIILGFPYETKEDIINSIETALKFPFDNITFLTPIPFTHTELRNDYIKEGLIKESDKVNMTEPVSGINLSKEEIFNFVKLAEKRFSHKRIKRVINPFFFFFQIFPKINTPEKFFFLAKRVFWGVSQKF